MDKFKSVYNITNDIGKVVFKYKDKDVSQDAECEHILAELQVVCDKYRLKVGETEGKLARDISALFLEYLCKKDNKDG